MKVSNSKKQLAKIIHDNGGWREGAEFAVQGQETKLVGFSKSMPYRRGCGWFIKGEMPVADFKAGHVITNWHQTILSRAEYFHLYPAPDAKPEFCESVMRSIQDPEIHSKNTALTQVDDIDVVESKPTIEQLAADYRNAKDYAERKQEEADAAKADADAKLAELVSAGKALGFVLSVADVPEPELVITDWRDLRVGDEIEYLNGSLDYMIGITGTVDRFDHGDEEQPIMMASHHVKEDDEAWPKKWRFIRRP